MDEFGLVLLSPVWFYEVDFLKCSRSASQLSFMNLFLLLLLLFRVSAAKKKPANGVEWAPSALAIITCSKLFHPVDLKTSAQYKLYSR